MEVERLLTALEMVRADFEDGGIQAAFQSVANAANNAASNPTDNTHVDAFLKAIDKLGELLQKSRTANAPASVTKALSRAGVGSLVGDRAFEQLQAIIGETPFLLPRANDKLAKLNSEVIALYKKVKTTIAALAALGFEPTDLAPEECEVGILLPRSVIEHDLLKLQPHLKDWTRVISDIHELIQARPPSEIRIRSASTGSFELFVSIDAEGAFALLTILTGVLGAFMAVRRAKQQREEIEQDGFPKVVSEGMKRHEDSLIQQKLDEIHADVLSKASEMLDSGRRHELANALKRDLEFVTQSINRGVDIEVTAPSDTDKADSDAKKLSELISAAIRTAKRLPPRETPILDLPPPALSEQQADH